MFNKLTYESMEALSLYLHCLIGNPTGKEIRSLLVPLIEKIKKGYKYDSSCLRPRKNKALALFYNSIAQSSSFLGVSLNLDGWEYLLKTIASNDDALPLKNITAKEWESLFRHWIYVEEETVKMRLIMTALKWRL